MWLRPTEAKRLPLKEGFRIVCAVDLGEETLPILRYAKQLAQAMDAKVTLVHSSPEEELRPNKYFDYDLHKTVKALAQKELALMQKTAGTDFEVIVTDYPISPALTTAVDELKAGLVLIGRGHTRRFMDRFRTHTYDFLNHVKSLVTS